MARLLGLADTDLVAVLLPDRMQFLLDPVELDLDAPLAVLDDGRAPHALGSTS